MKKTFLYFCFALAALCTGGQAQAAPDVVIRHANLKIVYTNLGRTFSIEGQAAGTTTTLVQGSVPEATYELRGRQRRLTAAMCQRADYSSHAVADKLGRGVCHEFVFSLPGYADGVSLVQQFLAYEGTGYVLTRLTLRADAPLRSNYLAPIATVQPYRLYPQADDNRMLKVPYDNDGFVRYHKFPIEGEMTSYEVAALYRGEQRNGLVIGSVEHDLWKSAVQVQASVQGQVDGLKVFSGVSTDETRDRLPHGMVRGTQVSSALMLVGYFADWRQGMEAFAAANNHVQPGRFNWQHGTPFGWQSWGVMAEKNSREVDEAVSDYFRTTLNPGGFCNSQKMNVMSIDAWDNMNHEQRKAFCAHVKANGQIPGSYCTPFCLWWNEDMLRTHKVCEGSRYTGYDCVIKVNGEPAKYDGAYCLDPTHPGTKEYISHEVRAKKDEGFEYLKVDFTCNGMIQADSYYNKDVTTAVAAYNEGMRHFISEVDRGSNMFVALSIAPIFPYQYGNSRRIACDTWGKIGQSEYCMNAIGGGWWTNGFYQYNDPDHLVLVGNDSDKETEGENRARYTTGMASGMVLVSDNYSLDDQSGRGDAKLSRQRARQMLMNAEVNALGRLGRSSRPVSGYLTHNGKPEAAEQCMVLETDEYLYLSVVNYAEGPLSLTVPFDRLDTKADAITAVKELWTGAAVQPTTQGIACEVPAKDARIYRLTKK